MKRILALLILIPTLAHAWPWDCPCRKFDDLNRTISRITQTAGETIEHARFWCTEYDGIARDEEACDLYLRDLHTLRSRLLEHLEKREALPRYCPKHRDYITQCKEDHR